MGVLRACCLWVEPTAPAVVDAESAFARLLASDDGQTMGVDGDDSP